VLRVEACTSKFQRMRMRAWSFDITDLDRQIYGIILGLKRTEQSVDVLRVVRGKCAFWVLDFKDTEVIIALVQLLKGSGVDLILELGDSQVLDLNGIGDSPLKTDRCWRQVVNVLEQTHVGSSVQSFTHQVDDEGFSVHDLEERLQVVGLNFLWVIEHVKLHLLSWCKLTIARVDVKDFVVQDVLFKRLLWGWFARISP
jgi:hypothetical protein